MTATTRKVLMVVGALAGLFMLCLILGFIVVIIPTLGRARRLARRTACAANEKELGTSFAMRVAMNANPIGTPPSPAFGGNWQCDQPTGFTDSLISVTPTGAVADPRKLFYCPANANQSVAGMWAVAPYRITGYVWTNDRSAEPGSTVPTLTGFGPPPGPPLASGATRVATLRPSDTLAADWVISTSSGPATTLWTGITAPGRPGTYDSSHMRGGNPEGANVLAYDNHVAWRPFVPASATAIPQGAGGAGPYFWIPNP